MRRFLLVALIVLLVVGLAAALTGDILLYVTFQQSQSSAEQRLAFRATRISDLENELGETQTQLRAAEIELTRADAVNSAQQAEIATLQAQPDATPLPAPTDTPTPEPSSPRPTVFITAPATGDRFKQGAEVTIAWNALDRDGVARVTFSVDGQVIEELTVDRVPSVEGTFNWTATGTGRRHLIVTATNLSEVESSPAAVVIEVVADLDSQAPSGKDAKNAAIMDEIEPEVIALRGLEPQSVVTRSLYSRDALAEMLVEELDQDFPPEEAARDALEMAAFDLLPADTDLRELMQALYTEQIAGFYDTDTRSLTVVSDDVVMGPLDQTTYAHEFTHALQDQYFGLDALDPEENSDDASLAVTALIEGDATYLMQQYMLTALDPDEMFELLAESATTESSVLDSAPRVIREQMLFPYQAGLEFVSALIEQGGYAVVDEAFRNPPQSTEQILHVDKYLADEKPQLVLLSPLTDTLGSGWQFVDENVLGEFGLQLYLDEQLSSGQAATAAAGWGGDRYAVYAHQESDALVMVLRTRWDSAADASEFVSAFQAYARARYGFEPETRADASCWQGQDAICLYPAGTETLVVRAPDLDLIEQLAALLVD